jgi:hypothetical protein
MSFSAVASVPSAGTPDVGLYIEGSTLVVPDGYVFPAICPLTGQVQNLERPVTQRLFRMERRGRYFRVGAHDFLDTMANVSRLDAVADGTFSFQPSARALLRWKAYRVMGFLAAVAAFYFFTVSCYHGNTFLAFLTVIPMSLSIAVMAGVLTGLRGRRAPNGMIRILGMPLDLREKIVEIEERRAMAAHRAALAQAQAQAQQGGTAAAPIPGYADSIPPVSGPPPIPLFGPAS